MTDARKRIAELEEALRPFAEEYADWESPPDDDTIVWLSRDHDSPPVDAEFTFGHLRRAAILLSEQTETPVEEHEMVCVPRVPTEQMNIAAVETYRQVCSVPPIWGAMIAAWEKGKSGDDD